MLDTKGSAATIIKVAHKRGARDQINLDHFEEDLTYFRTRYVSNGHSTRHFDGLKLRKNDESKLAFSVLTEENTYTGDSIAALLIIALRLRNDLFHGLKWESEIREQRENFDHANAVLMSALNIGGHH